MFALGSGHDPRVLVLSPMSGSLLSGEPASSSPSAVPHACALSRSLMKKLKILKKKKERKKRKPKEVISTVRAYYFFLQVPQSIQCEAGYMLDSEMCIFMRKT